MTSKSKSERRVRYACGHLTDGMAAHVHPSIRYGDQALWPSGEVVVFACNQYCPDCYANPPLEWRYVNNNAHGMAGN